MAEGTVEVVLRRDDQVDLTVDTMGAGEVIGEMSLLTGEPRSATVRAVEAALLYEIGVQQYGPHLRAHPEWVDDLARMMESRLVARNRELAANDAAQARALVTRRIRFIFFGG